LIRPWWEKNMARAAKGDQVQQIKFDTCKQELTEGEMQQYTTKGLVSD
jgi:hypothetical protein